MRIQLWSLSLIVLATLAFIPKARSSASDGSIEFQILDSVTGYAISSAQIEWDLAEQLPIASLSYSQVSSSNGTVTELLSPGEYVFEISAPGYKPLRTHFAVELGSTVRANINLDPIRPPQEMRKDIVSSQLRPGLELVHGYVVDEVTHQPMGNVRIKLQQGGATMTNSRGYFQLYANAMSTANASTPEDFPALGVLTAHVEGYKEYVLSGLLHVPASSSAIRIEMARGIGTTARGIAHPPLTESGASLEAPPAARNPMAKRLSQWLSTNGKAIGLSSQTSAIAETATTGMISVPSSIRVGSNCSNGRYGCTITSTYSLETYVQDGLDDEWISSWQANSLMAGAVAYRSYGAWFIANPICPTTGSSCPTVYDICASTYCQAFTTSNARSTVNAAKATAGVVLSEDGVNIFLAEYSANTNGRYCPDGQTGQPTANWPCMLDPIAAGSTGSGHGRGMSQWGSQYWARGQSYSGNLTTPRDWRCIIDHYYNANSNSITVDPTGTGSPGAGSGLRTAFMSGEPTYGKIAYVAYDSSGAITGIRAANAADGSGDYSIDAGTTDFGPSWESGGQRLAFANSAGIAVINADGTGLTQLTSNACGQILQACDFAPAWSPFSERIAFCSMRSGTTQIWMMDSDGSNLQQITTSLSLDDTPYKEDSCNLRWSPDETQITFTGRSGDPNQHNVYKLNSDGSNLLQLTHCLSSNPSSASACVTPVWSPDGTKIMFDDDDTVWGDNLQGSGIYTMNADGTGILPVFLENSWHNWWPHYSTDGNKIFYTADPSNGSWGVYSANPDGTSQTQIIGGNKYQSQGSIDCSVCGNFGKL